jgi:V/A-type H+-transporting ATPase subunit A
MSSSKRVGEIKWVSGAVVVAGGVSDIETGEIVEVGKENIIGEVIRVSGGEFTIQAYEVTTGLRPGEVVTATGKRLVAELGPGLVDNVLDGIGRPLDLIKKMKGSFIGRGIRVNTLTREKKWHFKPEKRIGDRVVGGDVLGVVDETPAVFHRIMVPPHHAGKIVSIAEEDYTVEETVAELDSTEGKVALRLMHEWPIRTPRPFRPGGRMPLEEPLVTGQRVIDTFFPLPKGGTASIPGGFGTGKTVMLHSLAKWSDCGITVYIGCGERGNEICEVLKDFPALIDPRNGRPLMERTIVIANTSNMPVAAREASIYLGVTMAEYYRDQGYDVAIMADSTSRWAEALREISGVLEEMPAEAGYPAYLPDRIAEFYERAGRVDVLGNPTRKGSVSIIGAVSPPGGDFNEPVTIYTLRSTGVFWALDRDLAYARHFPAIHWLKSYSLYIDRLSGAWADSFSDYAERIASYWKGKLSANFEELRTKALTILSEFSEIESIARIMGERALPDDQRFILISAELVKEAFLRQFAFDEVDAYCSMDKQIAMLQMLMDFYEKARTLVREGVPVERIKNLPNIKQMERAKYEKDSRGVVRISTELNDELSKIAQEYNLTI